MRFYLGISLVLGVLFVVVQSWGMRELIDFGLARNPTGGLWGMVVVLAVVHALHVVGGLVGLVVIYRAALRDRYDHEWHWPIQFVGNYWHFLDLVWIIMLVSFWMTSSGFI
jgi:cytochrome c oxidase subunit 3